MPITFAIDAQSANKEHRTGVEWHAYHLIQALKAQTLREGERVILYSPTPLQGELGTLPDGWESRVLTWPGRGWMKLRMSWEMLWHKPNVLFVPAQGLPLFAPRNAKKKRATVTTIHDVGFIRAAARYDRRARRELLVQTKHAIKRATQIFAVSAFTKSELVETFRVAEDRVTVVSNGIDVQTYKRLPQPEVQQTLQALRLSRHFFLYVGRMDAKKNVGTLIRAFELFKSGRGMGDPFELILVGSPGYGFDEIKTYYERSPVKDSIRYLGYLPSNEVAGLMNAATAFVFPSWYEGFGVPVLEAMACGAPVIASDIGAHREIASDAALLVSPMESEAIAKTMRRVAEEHGLSESMREKGLARAAQYTWDAAAKTVLESLRKLVE